MNLSPIQSTPSLESGHPREFVEVKRKRKREKERERERKRTARVT